MKRLTIKLAIALLTFTIGVAASILWLSHRKPLTPCEQGKAEARRDIQNDKLSGRYCGKKGEVFHAYQTFEKMEKEYGIKHEWVGDCVGDGEPGMKAYCYNVEMSEEIEKRMGREAIERFDQMALEELNERHRK
jgi:hypothetical protein